MEAFLEEESRGARDYILKLPERDKIVHGRSIPRGTQDRATTLKTGNPRRHMNSPWVAFFSFSR